VYLSLDLTGMQSPLVFEASMTGYPLRFTAQDVLFKNRQGFLMQQLVSGTPTGAAPIPGMFVYPAATPSTDSDALHYSRHEFNTYFLQHAERLPHALDPTDPEWHVDGTRHIDHDHLIVAIMGRRNDGTLPVPGTTPVFTLNLKAFSLFYQGLVGASSVTMKDSSSTDSFDSATGLTGQAGDVFTNGTLTMNQTPVINGDATAASFALVSGARVTGQKIVNTSPTTFMDVKVPAGLPNLGTIYLPSGSMTINGPGSFQIADLTVKNSAILNIDNSQGPVTLYVTGTFNLQNTAQITVVDRNPEHFAIYVAGSNLVSFLGSGSRFYGTVYAPKSTVRVAGNADFYGAFVADAMVTSISSRVHYDRTLRGQ
jgi:hypothetical protein